MKNKSVIGICILTLIFSLLILSCSPGGTSKVTIMIDLGLQNKAAINTYENSIIDRVFRFFVKNAEAQSAPSNITSLTLNITGDGMSTITQNYTTPIPDTITIDEVPSGSSRTFEVLAYTPSATLRGAATRDLAGGETVTIPISMGLYETKIVIPDWYSQRLVQIDDMLGSNWIPRTGANIGYSGTFQPSDIEFDSQGRIYITNRAYSTGEVGIMCIDDINDTSYTSIISNPTISSAVNAIAINRNNGIIYYGIGSGTYLLYSCNLNGSGNLGITLSGITLVSIRGLAVDDIGNLFIAATINIAGSNYQRIIKYEPTTTTVSTYSTDLIYPWDVVVKGNYLYIADYDNIFPYDSSKVVRLSLNLDSIDQLGTAGSSTFHGPHRFLAILNNRFFLIDEDENTTSEVERIVAFDNFSSTIDAFDPSMISQSPFQFYSQS
jgi:hypothetical protein